VLTPGSKFIKLGGGLQQVPLHHPANFQPDRTSGLRDVRYLNFYFLALGAIPCAKVHQTRDKLLLTQVYCPAKFHCPVATHAGDTHYKKICGRTNKQLTIYPQHPYRHVEIKSYKTMEVGCNEFAAQGRMRACHLGHC